MTEPIDSELTILEEELRPHLSRVLSKSPKTEETKALIRRLQPAFDQITKERERDLLPFNPKITPPSFLRLLLSQIGTYQKSFWLISLVLFIILTLISSGVDPIPVRGFDLYSLTLPLFFFLTFAYSYRSWNREMRMVEQITPFSPAFLLLSRLLILLGMNLIFGLIGNIWLIITSSNYALSAFLLSWIAPLFLSGGVLAYFIFRYGMGFGFTLSLLAWAGWIGLRGWIAACEVMDQVPWAWKMDGMTAGIGIILLYLAYRRLLRHPFEGEEQIR